MKGKDSIKELLDIEFQRVEVPADLKDRLMQSIEDEPITKTKKDNIRKIDFSVKSIAVAASLLLIISLTGGLVYNWQRESYTPTDTCSTPEEVIYETQRAYQILASALNGGVSQAKLHTEAAQDKTKEIFDKITIKHK